MRKIVKLFKEHAVSTSGERGTGKDILQANVIARRKGYYVSNVDYKCKRAKWIKFVPKKLYTGNTYKEFLSGNTKEYIYPYPDGTDIYISDCGIYFPAQFCNELNRDYKDVPTFLALSRQLGNCNVHTNQQFIGRTWDKIREQQERYVLTLKCKVIGRLVIQKIRIYERYQACADKVIPFRVPCPLLNTQARTAWQLQKATYEQTHGKVKERLLIYINKSNYDTRLFKEILENGKEEQ